MLRKRKEIRLIEVNSPDPAALPVEMGLNLPCMKGCRHHHARKGITANIPTLEETNSPMNHADKDRCGKGDRHTTGDETATCTEPDRPIKD